MELPLLELREMGVSFGQRVILDDITLSLPEAGIDVLMGPVKAGKSTFLNTLSGRYDGHPLQCCWGTLLLQGKPLTPEHRPHLVPQHVRTHDQRLMEALLKPIRESGCFSLSPGGWREMATSTLSNNGLEQWIVEADQSLLNCPPQIRRAVLILAQALLKPALLMVDEPTYGLADSQASWMIEWLRQLGTQTRLLVTLHNQIQARRLADRIALLAGGRIIAHQKAEDFFTAPANEWVTQFTWTGSLGLPSPNAKQEELAEDAPLPPPLSGAAQSALVMHEEIEPKTSQASPSPPQTPLPQKQSPITPQSPNPSTLRPVAIPEPSNLGITLAASVGDVLMRDRSAPRGFHWVVPGRLAGCPAPGVVNPIDYDLKVIQKMGVTGLITLTETDLDQESLTRHGLFNIHSPIFDREAPSIAQTHMLLIKMERLMLKGEVLAVHCKAGLGRTGTLLAAWMIRDGGFASEEAVRRLRLIEPGFIQSDEQMDFLSRYEQDLVMRLA